MSSSPPQRAALLCVVIALAGFMLSDYGIAKGSTALDLAGIGVFLVAVVMAMRIGWFRFREVLRRL